MLISQPAPSTTLDKITAAAHAAQVAYYAKFESYRKQHFADASGESAMRRVAERFAATDTGGELTTAFLETQRAHRAALAASESITITGKTWEMHSLSALARDAVYAAVAEHGVNTDAWSIEERERMARLLDANPSPPTFGEVADSRRAALANLRSDVDNVLDEHGLDPSRWPVEALDGLALAQLRIEAFDQLVRRARALDVEWSTRTTNPVTTKES